MIQPVGGEAGAGEAVLPEPLVDDDEAEVLAERLDHLEQDFVRREHDIGLFGRRLLRLIVASLVERAARLLVLADSAFHLRADLERGLYRLDIAAHRLVRAELGAFAALPDCYCDAVGHLAARLVRQPVRRHGVQDTVRQSTAPGLDDEPGDCLSAQFRLADAGRDFDGVVRRVFAILGLDLSKPRARISACLTISSRMPRNTFRPSSAEGPPACPCADACSGSVS